MSQPNNGFRSSAAGPSNAINSNGVVLGSATSAGPPGGPAAAGVATTGGGHHSAGGLGDGPSNRVDVIDAEHGRILCIADVRGRLSQINELAKEYGAKAVIHSGDFGFYEPSSLERISDRTLRHLIQYSSLIAPQFRSQLLASSTSLHRMRELLAKPPAGSSTSAFPLSEFPDLLTGKLKFDVPVYTVWGACEDVSVIERIRAAPPSPIAVPPAVLPPSTSNAGIVTTSATQSSADDYSIPNLTLLDEATTRCLVIGGVRLRLFGLGGAVVPHKLFDNGEGGATIAGGQGTMWTTILQVGEIVDTAQRVYDPSETRLLVSHASPGREGLLAQLGLVLKADLTVSAGLHFRYGVSYNEFSVQHDQETFRAKLHQAKVVFNEIFDTVKDQVKSVIDDNQAVLLENALAVTNRVPAPPPVGGGAATEESAWKNSWHWNLPDAAYGNVILDIREGRVGAETRSQGFNFSYRAQAAPTPVRPVAAAAPVPVAPAAPAVATPPPNGPRGGPAGTPNQGFRQGGPPNQSPFGPGGRSPFGPGHPNNHFNQQGQRQQQHPRPQHGPHGDRGPIGPGAPSPSHGHTGPASQQNQGQNAVAPSGPASKLHQRNQKSREDKRPDAVSSVGTSASAATAGTTAAAPVVNGAGADVTSPPAQPGAAGVGLGAPQGAGQGDGQRKKSQSQKKKKAGPPGRSDAEKSGAETGKSDAEGSRPVAAKEGETSAAATSASAPATPAAGANKTASGAPEGATDFSGNESPGGSGGRGRGRGRGGEGRGGFQRGGGRAGGGEGGHRGGARGGRGRGFGQALAGAGIGSKASGSPAPSTTPAPTSTAPSAPAAAAAAPSGGGEAK